MNRYFTETRETLRRLKPELRRRFHVADIGLFGSIVRDDFSPQKSDVDVLVTFSQPVGMEFLDLAETLEKAFARKTDLVSRNGIRPPYLAQIEKEVVYV
ncbi:MAG: nucleotidyltransferase family protein [Puniceicoccales bacterium]|nr:nucleotidyltransferase family protein [Puniceicoccales bacterium]